MLRIEYRDQNDPKDMGAQDDSLTQEIAAGNYSIALELDAGQLGLGPSGKKVIASSPLPSHLLTHLTPGGRHRQLPADCVAVRG